MFNSAQAVMQIKSITAYFLLFILLSLTVCGKSQIVRIDSDQEMPDSVNWAGSVDLNINSVKNNNQFFRLAIGSDIKHRFKKKNKLLSTNSLNYVFAGANNFENRGHQHLRYQRKLDSLCSFELFTQIQFDHLLKINLRYLNGTGMRLNLVNKPKNKISFGLHYMYEYEEERETGITNRDHRLSSFLMLSRKIEDSKIYLISYYQPRITGFYDYRLSASLNYAVKIKKHFIFNIRGELVYDRAPVVGITPLVYSFTNGFSYKF